MHEHKRLGRGTELAALAEQLCAAGIGLEVLTGELQGSHDPSGVVFTVLSGMEREYIRDHPGRPQVSPRLGHVDRRRRRYRRSDGRRRTAPARPGDEPARHCRLPHHRQGKKKGQHPSSATVMRMLREHDEKTVAVAVG